MIRQFKCLTRFNYYPPGQRIDHEPEAIAQRHHRVVWLRINGIDQSGEGDGAAVNVADRDGS